MKKTIIVIIMICFSAMVCAPIFALSLDGYEPYEKEEFPKWSLDLRRAECIFFGGIPIAYPLIALSLGLFKQETDFGKTLAISCGVTLVIAVIDYILGVINED
ncbi:MAG: hypothetical protein IKT95_02430 [Spirochaetales bacterium]|nr:hypothetical protein [Spirochaetales bacterium]